MNFFNFRRNVTSDPASLHDCRVKLLKLERKLGKPIFRKLWDLVQRAEDAEYSEWILAEKVGKKQTYICSTCGEASAIANRYCLKCGMPKFDKDGKIKRNRPGDRV